jgi:tetratricopeptide (TPR) repeat protein
MTFNRNIIGLIGTALLIIVTSYVIQNRNTLAAIFFQTLHDQDRAIEYLKRSIVSDPEDAYAYYQLGLIYKERRDFVKAENIYLKLLKLFPDHPYANYDLGYVYREMKLYKKAIEQYKKALKIDPENINALFDIGYIYKQQGMYRKCLPWYEKVLSIDSGNKYALWDIAEAYDKMGMKDEAKKRYKHYHEIAD